MSITRSKRPMIAAIIAAAALTLAGCSGTSGSASGSAKSITFYTSENSQYAKQQRQWFADVSAAFKKQTGATVSFQTYSSGSDELTKIQTSVVSNHGPDVYDLGTTFTPTAYSTGAFVTMNADNWKAIGGKDKFVPSTLGISGPDAKHLIGVPWYSQPYVLAYNTDLLAKAGIAAPSKTWDGLAAQAKTMTGNGVYGLATGYKDGYLPWKFIWAMDEQAGSPVVEGKKADISSPATLKAYQAYFGWLTKDHIVDPSAVGWNDQQALAAFASGKAAYYPMTSTTAINTFDQSPIKGKYKFAVMPTVAPGETSLPSGGKPAASILSGENLVVAKYSKNQALDFEFIKFLTDSAQQKVQFDTFGNLPVNKASARAVEAQHPDVAPIVQASAASQSTPFTGAWGDIELMLVNVVVQSIQDLSSGSVDEAKLKSDIQSAQGTAQSALNRSK